MGLQRVRGFPTLSLLHGKTGRRLRRGLAAALLLAAAVLAVLDNAPTEPSGTPTVVATHHLTAGSTVTPGDLRLARFPRRLRPSGAFTSAEDIAGRTLGGAANAGEPITAAGLIGEHAAHAGRTTVPIRLADPGVARLLDPGTRVDVVTMAAETETGQVLATDVTVLTVTDEPADHQPGGDAGPLVLLAAPTEAATELAGAALNKPVTVTLH